MMRLSEAGAVAHERVFYRTGDLSEGTLEAIALALSACLDIQQTTHDLFVRKADLMRLLDWLVMLGLFRTPLAM